MPKIKFNPKAILFDMDGVIIDSMPYHFIAWYEALRPYGIRIGLFDVFLKEGERWDKSLKKILSAAGVKPTDVLITEIFKTRQKIFRRYFKRFIFAGSLELITVLCQKGYPLALVTGTPFNDARKILPKNIFEKFDTVVGGDCVKRGKPYPDPYLRAAKCLGVKPKDCLVIENAPLGVASAKAAGMFCVALTTSLPKEYLNHADVIFNDFSDIERFLSLDKNIA